MNNIFNCVESHFKSKLPFVIYKKPNENNIKSLFQKTNHLYSVGDFKENGFVFCNFKGDENILIPVSQSKIMIEEIKYNDFISTSEKNLNENLNDKNKFLNLVKLGITAIKHADFDKIVLSRSEKIELIDFGIAITFLNLVKIASSSFCYCFFHPKIGLWLGASPEQFLQISNNTLTTVALAGTQNFVDNGKVFWGDKEKREQQFVTDFIDKKLKKIGLKPKISQPLSAKIGNLLHLKTILIAPLNIDFNLKNCIQMLHPTPAVCGLPKKKSKDFIIENEGYNREFYSGFLGELNMNSKTDLFVNLRCMKIDKTFAILYVGCGITKDSIPEMEWKETVNKSYIMKKSLENYKFSTI